MRESAAKLIVVFALVNDRFWSNSEFTGEAQRPHSSSVVGSEAEISTA